MNIALENYQSEGRLLTVAQHTLKSENFYRKHTVGDFLPSLSVLIVI